MQPLIGLCLFFAVFGDIMTSATCEAGDAHSSGTLDITFGTGMALNCTGKADGTYEKSCKSYAVCTHGVYTITECHMDKVFNNVTGSCDSAINVSPPCGVLKDCSSQLDGRFPDTINHCTSFYTCVGHRFFGHTICPGGTVFHESLQTCDWPENVDPPCGTKGSP